MALDRLGRQELQDAPNEALKLFRLGVASAPTPLPRAALEYEGRASTLGTLLDGPPSRHGTRLLRAAPFRSCGGGTGCGGAGGGSRGEVFDVQLRVPRGCAGRCGELHVGLRTAEQVMTLARRQRSVSVRQSLAPLQDAAAARRDSACQDLARELQRLRAAA